MSVITVHTTPLSYRVAVDANGYVPGTRLHITRHVDAFTERYYDQRLGRYVPVRYYRYYNEGRGVVHLPRYDLDRFTAFAAEYGYQVLAEALPLSSGVPVSIPMKRGYAPRDASQVATAHYLTTDPVGLKGVAQQPGRGKTFISVYSVAQIGRRAMIRVQGLVEQWVKAVFEYTDLTPADVYVVKGESSLAKLLAEIDRKIFPKIIIMSIGTLRYYAFDKEQYRDYPPLEELCQRLGVGVSITDETHLNFHTNLILDLRLAVALTIVLTATFDASDKWVKKVFDQHYPPTIRFGADDYRRYVEVHAYCWSGKVGLIPPNATQGRDGYSHANFEKWLLKKPFRITALYRDVYLPLIHAHYTNVKNPGERLLILCATVAMCEHLRQLLTRDLPQLSSVVYIQGVADVVLAKHDVIFATTLKGGTGRDIPNLRTVLCTISIRSAPTNEQILGRLRELPGGVTPVMVYTYTDAIRAHVEHAKIRELIFSQRGKSFATHAM